MVEAREAMLAAVGPGVSTGDLDAVARDVFRRHGARSAPRLAYGFPARGTVGASVDDGQSAVLWEGLVLAVEPFLSPSADEVVDDVDGWTLRTADGGLVAQFEHTMVVTRGAPLVLAA